MFIRKKNSLFFKSPVLRPQKEVIKIEEPKKEEQAMEEVIETTPVEKKVRKSNKGKENNEEINSQEYGNEF